MKTHSCARTGSILFSANGVLLAAACAAVFATSLPAAESPRERLSLDAGWKFHLGDDWPEALRLDKAGVGSGPAAERFADTLWRDVQVPHDWAIELPFDSSADRNHGYKPLGRQYPDNSIAWYRREFAVPKEDEQKRIRLIFDGVYRDATVWVNGWLVKRHESGYSPLREDITDVLNFGGRNTIAVRVDATKFEGWLKEAGVPSFYYESPNTAHEWQTWRRSLHEFAPLLFTNP